VTSESFRLCPFLVWAVNLPARSLLSLLSLLLPPLLLSLESLLLSRGANGWGGLAVESLL
jgi:hypothetical protein